MMRGRQIGTWIGKREATEPAPEAKWSTEDPPRRKSIWRRAPAILLLVLIVAVAWWVRREGGYRRFIASLREGTVRSVEFQPYPNSGFVRIDDNKGIASLADWLRDARPLGRQYGALAAADCEMRIVMADGSVKHLWLGATGPMRSGGTLMQSSTYIMLKGDGWERVAFSSSLSGIYMKLPVSAQLPFNSIPVAVPPVMTKGIVTTAPVPSGEVDFSAAQTFLERGQFGQARRMLARAIVANASNGMAQQLLTDTEARIRIHLPQAIRELERELPANAAKLERERYLQLRERLREVTLMAEPGDDKVAELRQRLSSARPEPRVEEFKEVLRLGGAVSERYAIRDFAWSPDGASIATCGDDGRVRVWDTQAGDLLCSFPAAIGNKIYFSADGRKVWVWNDQGRTWWDVVTGKASDEAKVADDLRP